VVITITGTKHWLWRATHSAEQWSTATNTAA
jgi:hypothetical protein